MSGLVGYASSDEENDDRQEQAEQAQPELSKPLDTTSIGLSKENEGEVALRSAVGVSAQEFNPAEGTEASESLETAGPPLGPQPEPKTLEDAPILGPSLPSQEDRFLPMNLDNLSLPDSSSQPSSPYTANRALLRDLTLPPVPNLDLPASPSGTPPPGHEALTAKFETFLELKRTKGTHFNSRLAQSAAMRNPSLMDKLLGFVGFEDPVVIAEDGGGQADGRGKEKGTGRAAAAADQYATALPTELWDPAAFPKWAFRGELRRAQERMQKEREAERASGKRTAVEFVSASTAAPSAAPKQ